jgi:hypothetical protein
MELPVSKLVRSAVVLGFVGYCAWPMPADTGEEKKAAALPKIAAERLSPRLPSSPTRDPFRPVDFLALQEEAKQKAEKALLAQKAAAAERAEAAKKVDAARLAAMAEARARIARAAAGTRHKAGKDEKQVDPLAVLTLNGTSILGDDRLAVINGQLYTQGEPLKAKDTSLPPYIVTAISPYQVILRYKDKTVELKYKDPPARAPADESDGEEQRPRPVPPAAGQGAPPAGRANVTIPPSAPMTVPTSTARYD